jgi:fluoroquinolone transport system permease protein
VSAARVLTALRWDTRLQLRHGFYHAAAFVAALFIAGLLRLPPTGIDPGWLTPPLVASNLTMSTFYFMAGLVLLEKGEGTLEALVVTPLRAGEYLASKVLTLTALTVAENVAIVAVFVGPQLGAGVLPLALGIALASALFALVGFVAVVRYDSINEFLAPSVLWAGLASLPVYTWLLGWTHPLDWVVWLHPLHGAMVLMQAGLVPAGAPAGPTWLALGYGVAYPALWIAAAGWWSRRAFQRFVVARPGAR